MISPVKPMLHIHIAKKKKDQTVAKCSHINATKAMPSTVNTLESGISVRNNYSLHILLTTDYYWGEMQG